MDYRITGLVQRLRKTEQQLVDILDERYSCNETVRAELEADYKGEQITVVIDCNGDPPTDEQRDFIMTELRTNHAQTMFGELKYTDITPHPAVRPAPAP